MKKSLIVFIVSAVLILSGCDALSPALSASLTPAGTKIEVTPANTETNSITQNPAETNTNRRKLVGIAWPVKQLTRSNYDPDIGFLKGNLERMGYKVDVQISNNTQETQNSQIENEISEGCDVLVVSPVDGGALSDVLKEAAQANIPLIAYDKLLTNTDKCDYYVTFDNYQVAGCRANT